MTVSSTLMQGKRGLVMGVANDHSIAYGIARVLARHGAQLAFTYQGEQLGKRVKPLAAEMGSNLVLPCDVENIEDVDSVFAALKQEWGELDFFVHSLAYSDKNELKGLYADTSRGNFIRTMVISCFSFTESAKRAAAMMKDGGSMLTVSFAGGTHVMPNYNVMGVAKAALDSSVRYLAADYGARGIRVNALSPGPVRTWRAPASPARGRWAPSRRRIARCDASSRSTKSADRRCISCRNCRAASPATCISSMAATTSCCNRARRCRRAGRLQRAVTLRSPRGPRAIGARPERAYGARSIARRSAAVTAKRRARAGAAVRSDLR